MKLKHILFLTLSLSYLYGFSQQQSLGDLTNDGVVGVEDLMSLLSVFGLDYNEINAHPDCVPLEYDGYTYSVVQIGDKCWFAENLRSDGGGSIPFISTLEEWTSLPPFAAAQTYYNFDESMLEEHGRLYTYIGGSQACPPGWYLPDDMNAWFILEHEYADLNLVELLNSSWSRGASTQSGTKLTRPDYGGTNETGLSIQHSGGVIFSYQYNSETGTSDDELTAQFAGLNSWAMFWCANAPDCPNLNGDQTRIIRGLDSNVFNIRRQDRGTETGLSVRCVKTLNFD